jgi:hypothetical protein
MSVKIQAARNETGSNSDTSASRDGELSGLISLLWFPLLWRFHLFRFCVSRSVPPGRNKVASLRQYLRVCDDSASSAGFAQALQITDLL